MSAENFYQEGDSRDRAMILETNQSAWDERMRLMNLARERIILSTFDFQYQDVYKRQAMGTSAHAVGTAKALEMGEIEGAMSSLSIAVAGLMTVIVVPLAANLI